MTETKKKKCAHKFTIVIKWKCHDSQNFEGMANTKCEATYLRCEKCPELQEV